MYWMRGPAGVGKSAIAQTCAEKLKDTGHLGAAFFFTVNKHTNPSCLFISIAYQLTTALPDYRAAVDERISKDKSLVEKKIASQFRFLILERIQELGKQGKRVQPKVIFIDGLDECSGDDAQAEIIKIIASSVREGSTPFHWAIFSRAEPRIVSTFKQENIASVIHSVELPISREADSEIEMYLRGGFKNILENKISRNCRHHGQLIPISGCLLMRQMAYSLTLLLFSIMWLIHQTHNSVNDCSLFSMPSPVKGNKDLHQPFRNFMLSMSTSWSRFRSILLSAQFLLFSGLGNQNADIRWYVSVYCCMFGISECMFRDICHHLHAILLYEPFLGPPNSIDPRIDPTRPCYDQGQWFHLISDSIMGHIRSVHGIFHFYHKSFYDFLRDPTRSGAFCITTPAFYCKYLDRLIQNRHHYASSYAIDGSSMYFSPCICAKLTCYSRACVGAGHHQFLYRTILATWN